MSVAILLGGGCAHYPQNARMEHYDPQSGYRFRNLSHSGNSDSLQVFLAFSGGGFDGLYAALYLGTTFVANPKVEVTLVSRESLHEHLTQLRKNPLQPDPEEVMPAEPLANHPFSNSSTETVHELQL